ncbi:MAG: hypothetical protein HYU66_29640 [Armatimonadetes bacterium]|nr:hypothetical protein [Armatimonadota bacterium]
MDRVELTGIVSEACRQLPDHLEPAEVDGYEYVDSMGEPALRIILVFDCETLDSDATIQQLVAVSDRIGAILADRGVRLFPYFSFYTKKELAELEAAR